MPSAALVGAALLIVELSACGGRSLVGAPAGPARDGAPDFDAAGDEVGGRADAASDEAAEGADAASEGDAAADALGPGFFVEPPVVDCAAYAAITSCVVHVKPGGGAATGGGLTWATALGDVQAALDVGTCGCDVWLAGGTYRPTRSLDHAGDEPDPRNRAFVIWPGSTVFGGFAGDETSPAARAATGPETILSADLGVPGVRDDNAYHVVVGGDGATLDGLTLRDGLANGFGVGEGVGAGVLDVGAGMTLTNVRVTDNEADTGGGIFNDGHSRVTLVGCTLARNTANVGGALVSNGASTIDRSAFSDNVGVFMGGAVAQFAGTLAVADSQFLRNRSDTGGGVSFSAGDNRVERCWFEANAAGSFGAALIVRTSATAHVASSVFVANASVGFGGALALWTGTLDLEASSVVDNYAGFGGGFLVKDASRLTIADSVVWNSRDDLGRTVYLDGVGNVVAASSSDVPADVGGGTTFEADPRLANVPVATRLAELAGTTDTVVVTNAAPFVAAGDRIELGDDGVERRVTAVDAADGITVTFSPPWSVATPRWLRVDHWAPAAPSLTLDLTPTAASPLVDAASARAPATDVLGHARVGAADLGALELGPR